MPPTTAVVAVQSDQVASEVKAAYEGASAVHVKGWMSGRGTTMKIDVQLNRDSASGTVEQGGTLIPVRRIADVYYVQLTAAVLKMAGVSPTTQPGAAMNGKWVTSRSKLGSEMASGLKNFLSYEIFVPVLVGTAGSPPFTAAGSNTVNDVAVLVFTGSDGQAVDVATSSPHYLIRVVGPSASSGSLDFTGWGQPAAVTAPPASALYSGPGV